MKNITRRMHVTEFDPKTGAVLLQALDNDGSGTAVAQMLSSMPPSPDNSGGWEYAYPQVGTLCLVQTLGEHNYIIGFYQNPIGGTDGKHYQPTTDDIDRIGGAGGYRLESPSGSYIKMLITGLIKVFSTPWTFFTLDQINQQLFAKFKNMYIRAGGGILSWFTNEENKSDFIFEVHKKFDPTTDSVLTFPETPERNEHYPNYSDKFIIQSRKDDAHMIEMETRQAIDGNEPDTQTKTTYGRNASGIHIEQYVQDKFGRTATDATLANGILHERVFTNDANIFRETIYDDGKTELRVNNDKAIITVDADGTIYIKSDTKLVHIGGPGTEGRALLTEEMLPFILDHVHQGNMGVTTSPAMYKYPVAFPFFARAHELVTQTALRTERNEEHEDNLYTTRLKGS